MSLAFAVHGEANAVVAGVVAALDREGHRQAEPADIVILSCPLRLDGLAGAKEDLLGIARRAAEGGSGRILFLVPALAGLPARRFPERSIAAAAVLAGMRGLAMQYAPGVLVNGVGVGTIVDGGRSSPGTGTSCTTPRYLGRGRLPRWRRRRSSSAIR